MMRVLRVSNAEIRRAWGLTDRTLSEAAALIGMSVRNLQDRAKALGLPPRVGGKREEIDVDELRRMWLAGVGINEIALGLRVHPNTVSRAARRHKLPRRVRGRHAALALKQYLATRDLRRQVEAERAAVAQRMREMERVA